MPADKATMKTSEHRRSNKPIMEKRRRARINSCLDELKNLLLEAMKKDPARHSKLEKADILEMTVKHLQNLQRQQMALSVAADPTVVTKYRAGFNECAEEVSRYVSRVDGSGIDPCVRQRLLSHLASCLNGLSTVANLPSSTSPSSGQGGVSSSTTALQLIPSRLPNGDVAFLLPGPGQMIPIYQHHTYVATPQGAPDSTTSSLTVSTSSSSSSSCSSVSSSALLSPCGSLRSSSSSPGVISSPGVRDSPGVFSPGDVVKVEEVGGGGGFGGRGLDEEDEDMSHHLEKQQHAMVDRSAEMLMPVNLSKDADKMWRPW